MAGVPLLRGGVPKRSAVVSRWCSAPVQSHAKAVAASDLRWLIRDSVSFAPGTSASPDSGMTALENPSFEASLRRACIMDAARTAPDNER